ncbi:MAG: hypothetical protein AAFY59_08055 [Pseudomonadota bacterium]
MADQVMIEMDPGEADALAAKLAEGGVVFEGPDEGDNLDGITIAAIVVTVTPVVSKFLVDVIKSLKGSRAVVQTPERTVHLENATVEEIKALLGAAED